MWPPPELCGLVRAVTLVVLCGCARETTPVRTVAAVGAPDPYPVARATLAERELFGLLNDERARVGLPPLAWNGHCALVAREHSEAVRDGGHVDLESAWLARIALLGAANFARARTIQDSHAALMQNSRQRANILSAAVDQVGVGVVEDADGEGVIVTEVLVRATPAIDVHRFARALRAELPRYALKGDRDLDAIAQAFTRELAAGRTAEEAWPGVRSRISEIDRRYVNIAYSVTTTSDPDEVQARPILERHARGTAIGIAVAQAVDPRIGAGPITVVVIIGRPL